LTIDHHHDIIIYLLQILHNKTDTKYRIDNSSSIIMSSLDVKHVDRDEFGRLQKNSGGTSSTAYNNNNDSNGNGNGNQERYTSRGGDEHGGGSGGHYGPASTGAGGDHYGPAHYNNNNDGGMQHQHQQDMYPGLVVQGQVSRIEPYGAFLDFTTAGHDNRDRGRSIRGLAHISQLTSDNRRVEQVTDILQLKQSVYAVILNVEHDGRQQRIRMSLRDVNQQTGEFHGTLDTSNNNGSRGGGGGGGRPVTTEQSQRRALQRRDAYLSFHVNWKDGRLSGDPPSFLRALWNPSPEPPSAAAAAATVVAKKAPPAKDNDSSSDDDNDSSSSSSSSDRQRRSRKRTRDRPSRKKQDDRRRRDDKSRRKRRGRKYASSSSSSSSSSESGSDDSGSSSDSSSPSSASVGRDAKRQKNKASQEEAKPQVSFNVNDGGGGDEQWKEEDWKEAQELKGAVQRKATSDDEEEGPMPLPNSNAASGGGAQDTAAYGSALLAGEGQAIAQYVQQNLRIPRRGEIGYSGDDIEGYEQSGYVMSGSRHARMNAVRIRKENQVYSAEEQRALALITMEENQQKEAQLMEDFRIMLKEKQKLRDSAL
jgi:predicted RNA-binding protein with RPS1 domain